MDVNKAIMSARNKTKTQKEKNINVAQINIDYLSTSSQVSLEKFFHDNNLSVCAIQETRLTETQLRDLKTPMDISYFSLPLTEETRRVSLAIQNSLNPQRVKYLEKDGLDIIWCMVKLGLLNTLIASVYCPPEKGTGNL